MVTLKELVNDVSSIDKKVLLKFLINYGQLIMQCRKNLNRLEELTQPLWRECAECNGWKYIIDWIIK